MRFITLITLFLCLPTLAKAHEVRTVIIYTTKFLKSYSNGQEGPKRTEEEIEKLNQSLKSQGATISFKLVAREQITLETQASPQEHCLGFTGDDYWQIPADPNFGRLNEFRSIHKADVVFLITAFESKLFKEERNYGIACDPLHDGSYRSYLQTDPSYLIIDKLGLNTLTLSHEAGHFLGLEHHYVRKGKGGATMMVGNGNQVGLKRLNLWSQAGDSSFEEGGVPETPPQGLSDIEMINLNAKDATEAYERWILRN